MIETEGGNQETKYVAYDYDVVEIGKKLPSCMKKPMYVVYEDGKYSHLAKNCQKARWESRQ